MKFIFLLASILLFNILEINGQTTSTTSAPATTEQLDASSGGKFGNPGAQIRFSTKALDKIYSHALEMISQAIRSMIVPDVIVPIGAGMLTIRSTRVTEAKISNFERQLLPPNRIQSRLTGGRLVSIGEWQYKPFNGARQMANGIFRTVVSNATMNLTNQLGRTWDAKPMVQTTECKSYLGQFRVEIEGFGENTTTIDQCDNLLCKRIRSYFEDAVCNTARNYIKETINQKLSTFPTRINLGSIGNRFVLDYNLLMNEPKVTDRFIQAYLEGDVLARGSAAAPFYANDLQSFDDNKKMISFPLSDFAFNALFHHAHQQQYRFSAFDLLWPNSSVADLLKLNCTSRYVSRKARIYPLNRQQQFPSGLCLGSIFDNATQFSSDAVGDLVFKSQRPLQVIVRQPPQKSLFGLFSADGGMVEVYGAAGSDGKRELLGKANIQLLRGDFMPKMDGCNITGSVNITDLQFSSIAFTNAQLGLASQVSIQTRLRSLAEPTLKKLTQLSIPILTEMFNGFLDEYAQFPMPLVEGYECASPEFRWTQRTMQIDSDVRVLADATRKGKQ
jgi:hypothetical protein